MGWTEYGLEWRLEWTLNWTTGILDWTTGTLDWIAHAQINGAGEGVWVGLKQSSESAKLGALVWKLEEV